MDGTIYNQVVFSDLREESTYSKKHTHTHTHHRHRIEVMDCMYKYMFSGIFLKLHRVSFEIIGWVENKIRVAQGYFGILGNVSYLANLSLIHI